MDKGTPGKRRFLILLAAVCAVAVLAWLDHVTSRRYSFDPFYLIPVLIVGWYVGRKSALVMTALALLGGILADYGVPPVLTRTRFWAIGMRVLLYVGPVLLLVKLREALDQARELSRVDFLTGIANRRTFCELAEMEKNRARRYLHPVTLAYLDIDDFKKVNDALGHAAGDEVLTQIARLLRENLRDTDHVARIGGD
jgi:predicted signal transduction protein with EAL and GGDEF domain